MGLAVVRAMSARRCKILRTQLEAVRMVVNEHAALNYLGRVLRLRPGDDVEFFDGQGAARRARLRSLNKEHITGEWLGALKIVDSELKMAPIPVLARLKSHAEDDAISALAALGFPKIRIFHSERDATNKTWSEKQSLRWERIADDSCRQSGGYWCTQIEAYDSLHAALNDLDRIVYGDSKGSPKIPPRGHRVGIVIGPEGGFSDGEKRILEHAQAQSIQLGQRTLRSRHAASLLPATVLGHWWSHA